jgi:hypothetical protein
VSVLLTVDAEDQDVTDGRRMVTIDRTGRGERMPGGSLCQLYLAAAHGKPPAGVAVYSGQIQARLVRQEDGEDYARLRSSALDLAIRSSDTGWHDGTVLNWTLAARCCYQASLDTWPVLGRLAVLLGPVAEKARTPEWPVQGLSVLAALRRTARAGERVLRRSLINRQFDDPERTRWLEHALVQQFTEHG